MIEKGELATSVEKNEIHLLGQCWEQQITSLNAFIFGVLERRLCVYNVDLKVDASQEVLTVIKLSYHENVHLC